MVSQNVTAQVFPRKIVIIIHAEYMLYSQRSAGKLACSKKTNFLSLVHLMKNAFKTPLRKSVSSVSTTGTTTSEGSAVEHRRRRTMVRRWMDQGYTQV